MISNFRKSANNIFLRIFLFLIAASFLGFGASIYMKGNSSGNVVSFTKISPITAEQFEQTKAHFIRELQQESGMDLKAENIDDLDINYIVLKRLVNQKMINYLADLYDLDISNDKIIKKIKADPIFMTDGKFDLQKFKSSFQGIFASPDQYSEALKTHIISSTIESIFKNLMTVSDLQLDNLINDTAEKKVIDIVVMDLHIPLPNAQYAKFSEDELNKFYQENSPQYTIGEKRKFHYLKIGKDFIQSKLQISDELLNSYYQENIEEYGVEHFNKVKHIIEENYIQEKTNVLFNELAKNLDEDIAAGMSFQEIASKYNLQEQSADYLTISEMTALENKDYDEIIDLVFDMDKDELSYPLEIQDKSELYIVHLLDIQKERVQGFEEVKDQIKQELLARKIADDNVNYMTKLKDNYKQKDYQPPAQGQEIKITYNFAVSKFQLLNNMLSTDNLPESLLAEILELKTGKTSKLYIHNGKIYFAYMSAQKRDNKLFEQIKGNSAGNYKNAIQEGLYLELLQYLTEQNEMKINLNLQQNIE